MGPTIYILGAGGQAKDVALLLHEIGDREVGGFVDLEAGPAIPMIGRRMLVMGEEEFFAACPPEDVLLALGTGQPALNRKLFRRFSELGYAFPNLMHPLAGGDADSLQMGTGNQIYAGLRYSVLNVLGDGNVINVNSTIGHDTRMGNFNVVNPGANISGQLLMGDGILVGTNATLLQKLRIGDHAVIGAGAIVTKDVPEAMVVKGKY